MREFREEDPKVTVPRREGARVLVKDGFIDDDASAKRLVLNPTDDARSLAGRLDGVALIELLFPKMGEGRPYTQARILREELGYKGALRAVGAVRRDTLFFLFRCGIDQAILQDADEESHAHEALRTYSVLYQGAADVSAPLYARTKRGAA